MIISKKINILYIHYNKRDQSKHMLATLFAKKHKSFVLVKRTLVDIGEHPSTDNYFITDLCSANCPNDNLAHPRLNQQLNASMLACLRKPSVGC